MTGMSRRQFFYLRVGLVVLGLVLILVGVTTTSGMTTALVVIGMGVLGASYLANWVLKVSGFAKWLSRFD
ncbi:MAG: hypothetical protein QOK05_2872 [Chloroflexota bacterium]|jgi:hypothetical protein|nr:hypothetical protein [Chloroflexota bacterium]